MLLRIILPLYSGLKYAGSLRGLVNRRIIRRAAVILAYITTSIPEPTHFNLEDRGSMSLRNVGILHKTL
jgi:hypothetical protein